MASCSAQCTMRHIVLWVMLVTLGFGQTQKNLRPSTSQPLASVSGTVFDPSDAVIVGASVTLGSGDRDAVHTQTDASGQFRFDTVAPGRYELTVEHPGFKTQNIRLKVGARTPSPVRIALAIADLQESVKVESSDGGLSLDPDEGADVIRLDPQQLESLPVMDGDIIGALSRLLDPSSIGTGGPTVIVDGLPGSARGIPISEIAEIRINSNAYSAEFARPGRARSEIITKSGSSSYHGSINFTLRDYRLDARNAFAVERPPERRRQLDASVSGPVHKGDKKETFTLSISRGEDAKDRIIYGVDLKGPLHENADQTQPSTYVTAQFP